MAKRRGNWSRDERSRLDKALRRGLLSNLAISQVVQSRDSKQVKSHLQKVKATFKRLAQRSAGGPGPYNIYNSYIYYLSCVSVSRVENEACEHVNVSEQMVETERFDVDEELVTMDCFAGDGYENMCTSGTTNSYS